MSGSSFTSPDLFGHTDDPPRAKIDTEFAPKADFVVQVVFDRPLETPLSYAVSEDLRGLIKPGVRVSAPLGRTREEIGFCVATNSGPSEHPLKNIMKVLDEEPLVDDHLLRLTRWMSDYYLCSWGQVLAAVVPSAARSPAPSKGIVLFEATEALRLLDEKSDSKDNGASVEVEVSAESPSAAKTKGKPKKPKKETTAGKLTELQEKVRRVLLAADGPLTLKELLARSGTASGPVESLLKRGLINRWTEYTQTDHGATTAPSAQGLAPELTPDQARVWESLSPILDKSGFQPILLRGVTGSGKTEVYLQAIQHCLARGQQALVLVPEISLTPQTVERFRARCGETAVLHSNLTPSERGRYWRRVASGEAGVAVGARSAIFAPARKLGLIIVDEEHESSFKQENTPRYNARDVAVMRARMLNIPVILGSATPSLESWHNATKGIYKLLELPRRVLNLPMPKVDMIDLRYQPQAKGEMRILSEPFLAGIHEALKAKGQVLLLLNRRGWAPQVLCPKCGKVVHCNFCDVPMTYHRGANRLRCHHCTFSKNYEVPCPSCGTDTWIFRGFGTERLVEELGPKFPGKVIRRMDSDTVRKPGSHQLIQDAFRSGMVDILVGTQMIAKGLDFPNVQLVGVVHADIGLQQPDFRAGERTFQLLAQVAGRAGRKEKNGRVLVQTYQPDHPSIQLASQHDFLGFAQYELEHRKLLGYPPWQRMARMIVRGIVEQEVIDFADQLGRMARNAATQETSAGTAPASSQGVSSGPPVAAAASDTPIRILGPSPAPVARIENHFRYHLQFQSPSAPLLHRLLKRMSLVKPPNGRLEMAIDIDPQTIL